MKTRYLIPLLLVSCTANVATDMQEKVYQNVYYYFNFESRDYKVVTDADHTYNVSVENVYYIYAEEYYIADDNSILSNEFYIKALNYKLYVYYRK